MDDVTSSTIAEYLDRLRFGYRVRDERAVLTGIRCPIAFYDLAVPIEICVGRHWVAIRACVQHGVTEARRRAMLSYLSGLNAQCREVRFFVLQDYVFVQLDVPLVQFHFGSFATGLRAVCRYATATGLEITVLATSLCVAELYVKTDEALCSAAGPSASAPDDMDLGFDITANRLSD